MRFFVPTLIRVTPSKSVIDSKILSLYGKIQGTKNPYSEEARIQRKPVFRGNLYSGIFYAGVISLLQGNQYLQIHYEKRMHDPGKNVFETKSDSMQLYSIFAKHMVIVQEKKDSTGMSWDSKGYELSATSNKPKLTVKSKNLQFYDKIRKQFLKSLYFLPLMPEGNYSIVPLLIIFLR